MVNNLALQELSLEEAQRIDGGSKLFKYLGVIFDYCDENWNILNRDLVMGIIRKNNKSLAYER